jgi:hypothetical protein
VTIYNHIRARKFAWASEKIAERLESLSKQFDFDVVAIKFDCRPCPSCAGSVLAAASSRPLVTTYELAPGFTALQSGIDELFDPTNAIEAGFELFAEFPFWLSTGSKIATLIALAQQSRTIGPVEFGEMKMAAEEIAVLLRTGFAGLQQI